MKTELALPVTEPQGNDQEMIEGLKRETFDYFLQTQQDNGLLPDCTRPGAPASIAVMGLALSCYAVAAERGMIARSEAVKRTLAVLRFFRASAQGPESDATGYKGFYYHFLKMENGRRAWDCELSTIDTAILIAGALSSAEYFDRGQAGEGEIRKIARELYDRVDWRWALNGADSLTHGWKPESGFLPFRWDNGYSEAHILYVLALGSETFPIGPAGYAAWTRTFKIRDSGGEASIYAGPLFIHQMSQLWLDLKGIRDELNERLGFDYFENSRRATYLQRQYAIDNPKAYPHYGKYCWGITASDGPGPAEFVIDGRKRVFYDYVARGAPDDIDDGTVSPWAVVSSLPFAPEITLGTIRHAIERLSLKNRKRVYGFDASFNPAFPDRNHNPHGWVSPWRFGLNQGPIVLMIENHQTGFIWKLMRKNARIVEGLKRAGFKGGWLESDRRQS